MDLQHFFNITEIGALGVLSFIMHKEFKECSTERKALTVQIMALLHELSNTVSHLANSEKDRQHKN